MQTTTLTAAGPAADPMASALAAGAERFERRAAEGTLDMAAVLHDARTPLTVITASVGMAFKDAPEAARPHLDRVERSARLLEGLLVRGLELLRTNPEGSVGIDVGALVLAAASLPPGAEVTLRSETVLGADGVPFSLRGVVEGAPAPASAGVPASARRAVLRRGGSLWSEAGPDGGTRYVAEVPCPRAA